MQIGSFRHSLTSDATMSIRNPAYLAARAAIAAHDAETFGPSLARVRARDARGLIDMLRERLEEIGQ